MIVHTCEQGSPEWFKARAGMPTASEYATLLAKGRDGGPSLTRKTYMLKLAGELMTGEPMDAYSNAHMERGKEMEAEARSAYELITDASLTRVGFVQADRTGCSPDALIGADGVLEVKTKVAHLHIEALLRGSFPPEHKAQCQGALWVCEREWLDLVVYWPKLPLLTFRATRDEPYIAQLSEAVSQFNRELDDVVAKVRGYSGSPQSEVRRMLQESVA